MKPRTEKLESLINNACCRPQLSIRHRSILTIRDKLAATVEIIAACDGEATTTGRVLDNIHATFTQPVVIIWR